MVEKQAVPGPTGAALCRETRQGSRGTGGHSRKRRMTIKGEKGSLKYLKNQVSRRE